MCGIAGIVSYKHNTDIKNIVFNMCQDMSHRGPDNINFDIEKNVVLGHARLSIMDLSRAGNQPLFNRDKKIAACVNGEIYNYKELKVELERDGVKFSSGSDSEVVPHLYEKYGVNFVNKLNGMFAISIHDKRQNKLLLIRDRFGEKPLYYFSSDSTFAYASEMKPLFRVLPGRPKLSRKGVSAYISLRYIPSPLTVVEGIKKLKPGFYIELSTKERGLRERRFYNHMEAIRNFPSIENYTQSVRITVEQSIDRRLMSDAPIGLMLSGGVDSSIIAGVVNKKIPENLSCYTLGFPTVDGSMSTDAKLSQELTNKIGYKHNLIDIRSFEGIDRIINNMYKDMDEPDPNLSCIATYLISKEAHSDGVKVLLSGDSADEAFLGYKRYLKYFIMGFNRIKYSGNHDKIAREYYKNRKSNYNKNIMIPEMESDIGECLLPIINDWVVDLKGIKENFTVNAYSYLDQMMWVSDMSNMRLDKLGMLSSVEIRAPFLDYNVQELARSLPIYYKLVKFDKLPKLSGKSILKAAFSEYLPSSIARQKKEGFSTPIIPWFRGNASNVINEWLEPGRLEGLGFCDAVQACKETKAIFNMDDPHYKDSMYAQSVLALSAWCGLNDIKGL